MSWKHGATTGQIVAGGNGNGSNRLNQPINVVVDKRRNHIFINDLKNRRIVRWPCENGTSGDTIISNVHCRGLAIDNNGYLYVSEVDRNEVRQWKMGEVNGTLVTGGNGVGNFLNQLDHPTDIVVDDNQTLYIFDCGNRRVMKWMKDAKVGIVVAGGGNGPIQLSSPNGLVVDHLGTVYVADWRDHRILRWRKGDTQWNIIISKTHEEGEIDSPRDLSMDRHGVFYVVEYYSHRLQRFDVDQN